MFPFFSYQVNRGLKNLDHLGLDQLRPLLKHAFLLMHMSDSILSVGPLSQTRAFEVEHATAVPFFRGTTGDDVEILG